jgi:hypothetical protein
MSAFPNGLHVVNQELFNRIWSVVEECGEEERHFNNLQSVYRGIASTWLLATFGAVGFLLFNKDGELIHPGIAAAVCFAGTFGIVLIWKLDLDVYHRLLVAVFREGQSLEVEFPWLPRFRTNMVNIGRKPGDQTADLIRRRLAWYYVCTALVPMGAGTFFWFMSLVTNHCLHCWYLLPSLALIVGLVLLRIVFSQTTKLDHNS